MKIYKLLPHLTFKVWGGEKLKELRAPQNLGKDPLGETWEVSIHKDGISKTTDGTLLDELVSKDDLSYLIKFIDTSDNLSIQVHPDDEYARVNESDSGKSECWLILDSKPGAGIYLGLKDGVSKHDLEQAIKSGKNVNELMKFYEVKKGDFFYVPCGSIHAIGKDVLLTEVQQSSGVTYRVWDWNRLGMDSKPRELHIEKAMDVINFEASKNTKEHFHYSENNFSKSDITLIDHPDFNARLLNIKAGDIIEIDKLDSAYSFVNLNGKVQVGEQELNSYETSIAIGPREIVPIKALVDSQVMVVK